MKREVSNYVLAGALSALLACLALAASPAAAGGYQGKNRGEPVACSVTSKAARLACGGEILDNYWIAIGKCANLEDAVEVRDCKRDAETEWRDGRGLCREQFGAREQVCDAIGQEAYAPDLEAITFLSPEETANVPNQYFPLVQGTRFNYENSNGERVEISVTYDTVVIDGVECIWVRDVVRDSGGVLIEDTDDFYAQDTEGNVWYLGEIARNYDEEGLLTDLEGSWRAGVDDARAGIVMKAHPMVGDVYRQEYLLADAEDIARVTSTSGSATVPAVRASCSGDCLVTEEFTPIDPDGLETKYYKPGIGNIRTVNVRDSGDEEVLVSVSSFQRP
jgi:hypothetical protein